MLWDQSNTGVVGDAQRVLQNALWITTSPLLVEVSSPQQTLKARQLVQVPLPFNTFIKEIEIFILQTRVFEYNIASNASYT